MLKPPSPLWYYKVTNFVSLFLLNIDDFVNSNFGLGPPPDIPTPDAGTVWVLKEAMMYIPRL